MGTPSYATEILKELLNNKNYEVIGIFTQEDKPVGRKQVLTPPHIKQYCLENNINIPILQPKKLKDNLVAYISIKELEPDFIVVAAYGQILPKEILNLAPCINLHASILPNYRGASPIQEGILNDDEYLGVTSMLMEEGLDCGDILGYSYLKNEKNMLVSEAFTKLSNLAAKLTITTLDNYDKLKPIKQNDSSASFCKKIKKEDGKLTNGSGSPLTYYNGAPVNIGGGIVIFNALAFEVANCKIEGNTAFKGGGIFVYQGTIHASGTDVRDNF